MKEIMRFQTDRNLHLQQYNAENEITSIVEELLESLGYDVPKENRPMLKKATTEFLTNVVGSGIANDVLHVDESGVRVVGVADVVDAYADIIVFATGAIMKLGFDPEKVLAEVGKEINSRVGSMVDGKFEKDLSDEAKANWYKADYSGCMIDLEVTK